MATSKMGESRNRGRKNIGKDIEFIFFLLILNKYRGKERGRIGFF